MKTVNTEFLVGVFLCSVAMLSTGCVGRAAENGARFPDVTVLGSFAPPGESNVRSSLSVASGVALVGTEESGDVFRTEDAGRTWTKVLDGGDRWGIQDVRNLVRSSDGGIYATTSEPGLVLRSDDDGVTWAALARAEASRTVALAELTDGTFLVGLRRSANDRISLLRSLDGFESTDVVVLDDHLPAQNTTSLIELRSSSGTQGASVVLCGVGFEGTGKIFRSGDSGSTWQQVADLPDARDLMNFFEIGGRVFVLASGTSTIYASDDTGESWTKHAQIWTRGFLGQHATIDHRGAKYDLISATDQRGPTKRHVLLISDDAGASWHEWIEFATDTSGGASNIAVIDSRTIVVGVGNHSVQGEVYTLVVD